MSEYGYSAGELQEGQTLSAEQLGDYDQGSDFILLAEGDYDFTVVKIDKTRYTPGPQSKIGPCTQVTLTLQVTDPKTGRPVDIRHNLYMWGTTVGMIAQYQDAIGIHKKGAPLTFDWRQEVHVGKTGKLQLRHRTYKAKDGSDRVANDIKKLYPKEQAPQGAAPWQRGY